ncbi:MAG: hypothetical protein CL840_21995 [Crocinitomicaceae bacterium]|nr:hypothetical protein [Crocinitomicaceae bacterium]|tara:strand:- start:2061 stop:2795 length:735 start_codon:yes stop_codon:yes gene_type:complete
MRTWYYFLFILLLTSFSGCQKNPWDECDLGEGGSFEEIRYFENFQTFKLDIPGQVIITPDTLLKSSKIVIIGQKNVIKQITTSINNGTVSVSFNQCFKNHDDIEFHIYTPFLRKIVINTASRVTSTRAIYGEDFTLELNSGSAVEISCNLDSITTFVNNSSTVSVAGYASRQMVYHKSSGRYEAKELISDSVIVDVSGAGYAGVYAVGHFIADLSGSGTIEFSGEDTLHVTTNISGSGQITDLR